MALWIKDGPSGEQFDDGLKLVPGEDGFTRAVAAQHFAGAPFSYSGTPNWVPPEPPAE